MIYLYLLILISSIQAADYSVTINEKSSIVKSIHFIDFPHSYELVNNFQSNFNLTNNNTNLISNKNHRSRLLVFNKYLFV